MPTLLATLCQITHLPTTIELNSGVLETKIKFKSNNLETYNNPFSLDELQDAISKSHDSVVGPDDIHYQMLKHLPPDAVNTLLKTLNNIWFAGNFPPSWRTSTVIPIPKPAKDAVILRTAVPNSETIFTLMAHCYTVCQY